MKKNSIVSHLNHKVESPHNEVLNSSDLVASAISCNISPLRGYHNDSNSRYFQFSKRLEANILILLKQLKKPLPPKIDLTNQNKILRRENQQLNEMLSQQKTKAMSYSSNHDINKLKQKAKEIKLENEEIKKEIFKYQIHSRPKPELKHEEEFIVYNIVNSMKDFIGKVEKSKNAKKYE